MSPTSPKHQANNQTRPSAYRADSPPPPRSAAPTFATPTPTLAPAAPRPEDTAPGWRWITTAAFLQDLLAFTDLLPHHYTAIVGTPRSGMIAAAFIATRRNLPLLTFTPDGVALAPSSRRRIHTYLPGGPYLLVDDDLWSGQTLAEHAAQIDQPHDTATVYTFAHTAKPPTHTYRTIAGPWLTEWKAFNYSPWLNAEFDTDFDGILSFDCPIPDDDDGPRYAHFLKHARPNFFFRPHTIPAIITARLEKYRPETLAWLKQTGQRVEQLIMGPWPRHTDRHPEALYEFKAHHVNKSPRRFFIESQPHEAQALAARCPKMIICPAAGKIYNGENYTAP